MSLLTAIMSRFDSFHYNSIMANYNCFERLVEDELLPGVESTPLPIMAGSDS